MISHDKSMRPGSLSSSQLPALSSLGISIRLGILLAPVASPALAPAKRVPAGNRDSPDGAKAWHAKTTT